jgi:ribosomal protein L17
MAAPLGNQYAAKSKQWTLAIERALEKRKGTRAEALDELAEKLLAKCDEADLAALRELGDRLEGKPGQSIDLGSDPDRPMLQKLIREIVKPNN